MVLCFDMSKKKKKNTKNKIFPLKILFKQKKKKMHKNNTGRNITKSLLLPTRRLKNDPSS